jgi:predicted nucleic acid-binding Zn ribbon protein
LNCPVCHKEFIPTRSGQKRCSASCNRKWTGIIRKKPDKEHTCLYCGKTFITSRNSKYCSGSCSRNDWRKKHRKPIERIKKEKPPRKKCVICGKEVGYHRYKTCSKECEKVLQLQAKRKYNNKVYKPKHTQSAVRVCLNCCREFTGRIKYCSENCAREYYDKNIRDKQRTREIRKKYKLSHKKTLRDKIRKKISNKISRVLNGERRSVNYKDVLYYSDSQLKSHLEKQFRDGMSWDNYGEWHIDHKIPVSAFNLMCDEDIKRCWSLKNLQPLFADENIRKSNKLDRPFQPLLI